MVSRKREGKTIGGKKKRKDSVLLRVKRKIPDGRKSDQREILSIIPKVPNRRLFSSISSLSTLYVRGMHVYVVVVFPSLITISITISNTEIIKKDERRVKDRARVLMIKAFP